MIRREEGVTILLFKINPGKEGSIHKGRGGMSIHTGTGSIFYVDCRHFNGIFSYPWTERFEENGKTKDLPLTLLTSRSLVEPIVPNLRVGSLLPR